MRFILTSFLLAAPLSAQTCTTATCTAASANESDVLAALPSSGNTNATVVVNIPTSTASWTSAISYTVPSAVTTLTIQGTTTVTSSGTAGTSSYGCSAVDNTVIQMNYATFGPMLTITTNSSSSSVLRMTGITWEEGSVSIGQEPIISIGGNGQIRWDHNHVNSTTGSGVGGQWVRNSGNTTGVVDHNLWDLSTCNGFGSSCPGFGTNAWGAFNDINDTSGGLGDGTYANATQWGSANAIYFEYNVYNGGASNDCYNAGFYVSRDNTMNDEYIPIQTHGTKSPGGPFRGCRGYEAYNNYITGPGGSQTGSGAAGSKAGPAMVWGNTLANSSYYRFWEASIDRNGGDSAPETNNPNGWGYCGTTTPNPSTGNPNGTGSEWDGNQPTIATGYPCLDGLGRGQTVQALNNQPFTPSPGRLNTVTGTIAWPEQYLEPVYLWNNSVGTAQYILIQDLVTTNNRDYYYDCGSVNSSCPGGFTGAFGTGFGLHANRPTACTAGPGGTYGASPGGGSEGTFYFATDDNGGRGEGYACTVSGSPGTWTAIYEPYIDPHPLDTGSGSGVSLTVSTSGTGSGSVSGTDCTSGSYTSGTSVGPCTATPSSGSTFTGWSSSGSASCSGTGTCPASGSFSLTASTTITASFSGSSPTCANPTQTGPNYSGAGPGPGGAYYYPPTLSVGFTSPTSGCSMFATFDGSTPTCLSASYGGTSSLTSSETIRVIACQSGFTSSGVVGGTWTLVGNAPPPLTILQISQNAPVYVGPTGAQ